MSAEQSSQLDFLSELQGRARSAPTHLTVGQNQFFLENKVGMNFDFRNGAKKLGHLDHPLESYGQIYFNILRYILRKCWMTLDDHHLDKKNIFTNDMTWTTCGLNSP